MTAYCVNTKYLLIESVNSPQIKDQRVMRFKRAIHYLNLNKCVVVIKLTFSINQIKAKTCLFEFIIKSLNNGHYVNGKSQIFP